MRQFVLMVLMLAGAGCQCLHDRRCRTECVTTEPCEKKSVAAPPEKKDVDRVSAPGPDAAARAAAAQEVLLVPRTVYMPFVAANPTQPMRMTPNVNVVGGPGPGVTSPGPTAPGPCPDETRQMLEMCRKLNERLDCMERCIKERAAPTVICPPEGTVCPPTMRVPLFRRPLFNRCEPLFHRCDPQCDTLQPCEPAVTPSATTPATSTPPTLIPAPARKMPLSPVTID